MFTVLKQLSARVRAFVGARDLDRDFDEELASHLTMLTEENIRRGMPPDAARRAASIRLGGHSSLREQHRAVRGLPALDTLAQDLRIAARMIARNPVFAVVVALTLALGIAATTTVFAVVNGVLLKPLAYPDADRIVALWQRSREHGVDDVAPANFVDWRERSRSIALMAAVEPYSADYMGPDGPERIGTWRVTEGFFEILGVAPALGRTFRPEDYLPGAHHLVVLGHGLWQGRFGGDPDVVGRTLDLSGQPTTVIGVMPPGFEFPAGRDSWMINVVSESERQNRSSAYYQVIGRLGSTTDLRSAQGELDIIAGQLARAYPRTNATTGVAVVPLTEQLVGHARKPLLVLLAAVASLLLIGCANVANLLLARAVDREREFATRAALGASGGRVVRQLVTESLLLAGLGGALGLLLAAWGLRLMQAVSPPGLPRLDAIGMEPRVVAFAVLVSFGTAVLFGLAPARQLARSDLHRPLRASGGSAGVGPASRRVRRSLVVAQVALAMVLLIGAGLLTRSVAALVQVNPGYRTDGVLAAVVHAWRHYPSPAERTLFVQQTVEHLAGLPGVQAAAVTSSLPLAERITAETATFEIEGRAPPSSGEQLSAHAAAVTSDYFEAMGIALHEGQGLRLA